MILINQSFLSLFITFILIELTTRGSGIIDGLFVSKYLNADAIAAVGIAKPIYPVIGIFTGLFSVGMQSRCSHELGRGRFDHFSRIFSAIFYISAFVSLAFSFGIFLGAKPLAVLMGASGNGASLADSSASYLRGISIGFPCFVPTAVLSSALQLGQGKKRVRGASLLYFLANVLLDYAAVILHLGIQGIALAASLGYYIQLLYLLLYFRKKDRTLFRKIQLQPQGTWGYILPRH